MSKRKLTVDEKYQIGKTYLKGKVTSTKLSQRFQISDSCVRLYGQKVRDGHMFHEKACRPNLLEPEQEKELFEFLQTKRISKRTKEMIDKIVKLAKITCDSRGFRYKRKPTSRKAIKAIEKV